MKNRDIDKIIIADKIFDDINNHLNRDKKFNDSEIPVQWRKELEIIADRLTDKERQEKIMSVLSKLNSDDDDSIMRKLERVKKIRRRKLLFVKISSFAAAIIAVSFLILNLKDYNFSNDIVINEVLNIDYGKVSLITDTGEIIYVENQTQDTVFDGFRIKSQERKLTYINIKSEVSDRIRYNVLKVPSGETYSLTLSDSTEVLLNAGSSIKYPVSFGDSIRVVELTGEAFFSVKHSGNPFVVKAENVNVTVYGTEFNVNILKNRVETILVEGVVGIRIDKEKEIIMAPNQMFKYDKASRNYAINNVDCGEYISWIDNNFKYVNRRLCEVLSDLSRWYDVEFNIREDLYDLNITLFSPKDDNIQNMIALIEMITNVKFINEGGGKYSIK